VEGAEEAPGGRCEVEEVAACRAPENGLDCPRAHALETALPRGPLGRPGREVQPGKLLEALRDRVVLRSQIGKRKLNRSVVRRELDDGLRRLGERYRALVKAGRVEVPGELTLLDEAVARLEERLAEQDREIAALEAERPRT
jgi:hypothetical protein